MTRAEGQRNRGFFGIGVWHPKTEQNIGTLLRTAYLYDAAFVFTVGRRYRQQASDTPKTPYQMPLLHYTDIDDLIEHLPHAAPLVGVELDPRASRLDKFAHPESAVYLLGAEDHGLPQDVIDKCHHLVVLDSVRPQSMNVATAGSIVIYDRHIKAKKMQLVGA